MKYLESTFPYQRRADLITLENRFGYNLHNSIQWDVFDIILGNLLQIVIKSKVFVILDKNNTKNNERDNFIIICYNFVYKAFKDRQKCEKIENLVYGLLRIFNLRKVKYSAHTR